MRQQATSHNDSRGISPFAVMDASQTPSSSDRDPGKSRSSVHGLPPTSSRRSGHAHYFSENNGSALDTGPSSSYSQAQQPINDAVTSAFTMTNNSISPDFIALITQNVIQQLQSHPAAAATAIPASAQPVQPPATLLPDQADTNSSFSGSPRTSRPQVYTPPSPHRVGDLPNETRPPSLMPTVSALNVEGYENMPNRHVTLSNQDGTEDRLLSDSEEKAPRPQPPRRVSTEGDPDATVVEKWWGKFFDEQGHGTTKLEEFLRGIAVHLIENFEPKNSLVVTPEKMQRFYEITKVTGQPEIYPWQHVFDDKTSSISRLLREPDVKVQHHLVQRTPDSRPDIPGLTPQGFATWITLMIRAHPEQEYERLAAALKEMPINHPDDGRRFPKELLRRQFPPFGDANISSRLAELMLAHCKVHVASRHNSTASTVHRQSNTASPPPTKRTDPPPPTVEDAIDESYRPNPIQLQEPNRRGSISEAQLSPTKTRETASSTEPASPKAPSVTSFEDGSDTPTPRPFERQRNPYVGQAGGGRTVDVVSSGDEKQERFPPPDSSSNLRRTKSVSSSSRPRVPPPVAIHQRPAPSSQHTPFQPPQEDGADLSRSRSTVVGGPDGSSMHRTRSNSSYGAQPHPFRRSRSNSTYANDSGRYHAKRSPSMSKGSDFPRASAPDVQYNTTYQTNSNTYTPVNYAQQQRDQYEHRSGPNYDPRGDPRYEREKSRDRNYDPRTTRLRHQSNAGPSNGLDQQTYGSNEDFYRVQQAQHANGNNGGPVHAPNSGYQYPPTAYKENQR